MTIKSPSESSILEKDHSSAYVWGISFVAALGGLLFGYDWVVIGGAKPFYEAFFNLTTTSEEGWAMGCALIGCLAGAIISGPTSDGLGRKIPLVCSAILFAISSIGTALAPTFTIFIVWRMIGGIAIGLASNVSPLYIAEVAPARIRGSLVSLNQLSIVIGIILAQIFNWLIAQPVASDASMQDIFISWNGQVGWRWMFGVTAIPSLLFLVGMAVVPESPRWLAKQGRNTQVEKILKKIGGATYASDAMKEITGSLNHVTGTVSLKTFLEPKLRRILGLGIFLAVFQQSCGINIIFNYAQEVFSAAGYKVSDILFNIVITGSVNLVFTLVALMVVDKLGRRTLLLLGALALSLVYLLLGICYANHSQGMHMLVMVGAAIGCYAVSLAPVTWVVISEIFPTRVRGTAMSLAVAFLWLACFILTYTFPLLNKTLGTAGTFWIYSIICALGFLFLFLNLPETKGKSLEEIEQELD